MIFRMDSQYRYLLYLLLLLPVFIFRDFTPANELKYLSIADEALRNNTWFTFYNHSEIYADKPPLFFWFLMLIHYFTDGFPMWVIGLFSLLPAIGILAVMNQWFKTAKMKHDPVVSELFLLTTAIFTGASLVMRMDMLMTFFIVFSLYTFFRIYEGKYNPIERWLLPVWIFLAIFSKGAMGFLVPVVSIVAFLIVKKQLHTFGRYLGWRQWGILLGLSLLWFTLIYWEGGSAYLDNLLFKQTIGRGVNSFHHKEPFWYYFPKMLWTFAPWVLLYVVLIVQGIRKRMLVSDVEIFFATIIIVNVVMLSLISSKIEIYMLPVYPFVVYLCSALFFRLSRNVIIKAAVALPALLLLFALPAVLFYSDKVPYEYENLTPVYIAASIAVAAGGWALYHLFGNKANRAVVSVGLGIVLMLFSASFALSQFNRHIGFREMAQETLKRAEYENISDFYHYKFYTIPNINVFTDRPVKCVNTFQQLDSLDLLPQKGILFIRLKQKEQEVREWLHLREPEWSTSKYGWYIIGGNSFQEHDIPMLALGE